MAEQTVEERIASYLEAEDEPQAPPPQKQAKLKPVVEEVEEEETEEEVVSEAHEEAADEPEETEEEEFTITSLQELAEHEGIDISDMYSLNIQITGPDGQSRSVPIGEIKDSYQSIELTKAERQKLQKRQQEFEQIAAAKKQEFEERVFTASKMIEAVEKQVLGEINNPQIQELRHTDPAEYAAIIADHRERVNQVNQMKQNLANEYNKARQKEMEDFKSKQEEIIQQSYAVLPKIIPEWRDEKVALKESEEARKYALTKGFAESDVQGYIDPRVFSVLREAMLYSKLQSKKPEIKKKVVSIGSKTLRSGKSKTKTERSMDQLKVDRQKLRQSGNIHDAADLINKHFLGEM